MNARIKMSLSSLSLLITPRSAERSSSGTRPALRARMRTSDGMPASMLISPLKPRASCTVIRCSPSAPGWTTSIVPSSTTRNRVDASPCSNRISPARNARSWLCGGHRPSLRQEALVDVAPGPGLAGLDRGHDRVLGRAEVLGGVAIRRRVAARDVAAAQALAEVHPAAADLQAIDAAGGRPSHVPDLGLLQVLAGRADVDVDAGGHDRHASAKAW